MAAVKVDINVDTWDRDAIMYDRWPGMTGPAEALPRLRPGCTRRTSSIDMLRPDGAFGPLVLVGRGQDVRDGNVLKSADLAVEVDYVGGCVITESSVVALVGARAGRGFRDLVPDDGSLLSLLMDEIPVVTLISRAALSDDGTAEPGGSRIGESIGVCAGWVPEGRLASSVTRSGRLPELRRPLATDLSEGFHPLPSLPVGAMRRIRQIDVRRDGSIDSLFRDSLMHPEEGHVVVHEYGVAGRLHNGRLTEIDAEPHVLPAPECPAAARSARRVLGRPVAELRRFVRGELQGTATCTHLSDHLRALGDIGGLV